MTPIFGGPPVASPLSARGIFSSHPHYLLIFWSSPSSLPSNSLVFFYFLTVDFIIQRQPSQPTGSYCASPLHLKSWPLYPSRTQPRRRLRTSKQLRTSRYGPS